MPANRSANQRPGSARKGSPAPAWRKSPEALVRIFEQAIAAFPQSETRKLFGYPCAFVNGQMATGLHQEDFFVRLGQADRAELVRQGGRAFEPMPGRPMREYVVLPKEVLAAKDDLKRWVEKAVLYTASLPAKVKTGRRKRSGKAQEQSAR